MLEGKRQLPVPSIRPDIVLYGDAFHPAADQITAMANEDMKQIDLLLVVGTSLRIPGVKDMVRKFSAQLSMKYNGRSDMRSILINNEKLSDAGRAEKYFDAWVEGDCQHFVSVVGNMKDIASFGADSSLGAVKEYAFARQDSRTIWRHY